MKIWDSWKDRFYAIFWIYKMCHDKRLAFFYDSELCPDWIGEPQEIFSDEAVAALKKGIDSESTAVLNNFIQKLSIDLTLRKDRFSISFPEYTEKTKVAYLEYMQKEQKEYEKKGIPLPMEEAAIHYHHGMRFLSDSIKNYVKDKIFVDGGACFGDSSLVFMNYSPKKVLAFDISVENSKVFYSVMKKNNIPGEKVHLILKGLGEKQELRMIQDGKGGITTLNGIGKSEVEIIPLDSCKEVDGTVGWIKIDLEGYGLPAVKGMVETIKRDRPVLTLAVYHCADELFGIKKLLESLDLNYKIMFRSLQFDEYHELTLIAYPAELE